MDISNLVEVVYSNLNYFIEVKVSGEASLQPPTRHIHFEYVLKALW